MSCGVEKPAVCAAASQLRVSPPAPSTSSGSGQDDRFWVDISNLVPDLPVDPHNER